MIPTSSAKREIRASLYMPCKTTIMKEGTRSPLVHFHCSSTYTSPDDPHPVESMNPSVNESSKMDY